MSDYILSLVDTSSMSNSDKVLILKILDRLLDVYSEEICCHGYDKNGHKIGICPECTQDIINYDS